MRFLIWPSMKSAFWSRPTLGTSSASQQPESLILERDEDYWRGDVPNVEAIEFKACPNSAAIASGFRAGDFDLARDLVLEDLEEILHDPRFHDNLVEKPQKFVYFILFNTQDLMLSCEDTAIVCTGTLTDGTTFTGMDDETRVVIDVNGNRCDRDDHDKDDDDKHHSDDD